MGGVGRTGARVLSREEGADWVSRQTTPVCIVRMDAIATEQFLFYMAQRHGKETPTPYPLTVCDSNQVDNLFAYTLEEGLSHINAFLYGSFPFQEAFVYRQYAPQAVALSHAPWDDAPLVSCGDDATIRFDSQGDWRSAVLRCVTLVQARGDSRVRLDVGSHQVALGLALKHCGISSSPKI